MPRPRCRRRLGMLHGPRRFKPLGIPARALEEVALTLDELEALRLADLEGLYHEKAAERMGVSRTTYGRILTEGRRKVADALVQGKMLRIGEEPLPGGSLSLVCPRCGYAWQQPWPGAERIVCPRCGAVPDAWMPQGHWGGQGVPGRGFRGRGGGQP